MNKYTRVEMSEILLKYFDKDQRSDTSIIVLDIGSYDVNGCLREIMPKAWTYIGLDIIPGPNVDLVIDKNKPLPFDNDSIDLIVSSSCFQYVPNPFKYMDQLFLCLKPGGMVCISAAYNERESPNAQYTQKERDKRKAERTAKGTIVNMSRIEKIDQLISETYCECWRFLKGGMRAVLRESRFIILDVYYGRVGECWGIGKKP